MRYSILATLLGVSLLAQAQPNCTGINLDFDARCACIKDPNSQVCALSKMGLYDGKLKPALGPGTPGWTTLPNTPVSPSIRSTQPSAPRTSRPGAQQAAQPARPQQAWLVPLAHKDYLRFLQPNANLIMGFDFEKISETPELLDSILGGADAGPKFAAAIKEMDHMYLSIAGSDDVLILMTGKFEQGAAAGMFYDLGVYPAFLGGAHAMLVGPKTSVLSALARLAKPPATNDGWAARRARELSKDHETWIVSEPKPVSDPKAASKPAAASLTAALPPIRRFALGFRLTGEGAIDGEAVSDSEANAQKLSAWVDQIKDSVREKTGVGALDPLTLTLDGSTVRFAAKGEDFLAGDAGKAAMNSDVGLQLYSAIMSGFPGMPARFVSEDKLYSVKAGMKSEQILSLLGPPLSVTSIQGLDTPRETWAYQTPFGKQLAIRLDGGVTTGPAH